MNETRNITPIAVSLVVSLVVLLLSLQKAVAVDFVFEERILPGNGSEGAAFGSAAALDDDLVAVGAPGENRGRGAVYLFQRGAQGWHSVARLVASDGAAEDFFGAAVALGNGILMVGAPNASDESVGAGKVYLFVEPEEGWRDMQETAILKAEDGAVAQAFGIALALDEGILVVGAPGRADSDFQGAVYLFEGSGDQWTQKAKLSASDGQKGDLFGYALDKMGDSVVVGAYGKGRGRGAAYLFRKPGPGWSDATEDRILLAPAGKSGERFGVSVALMEGGVAVGADLDSENGQGAGAIYLFSEPDWTGIKIIPDDGHPDQGFGYTLAAYGNTLVVGALLDDERGEKAGAIYVYRSGSDGWSLREKLFAEEAGAGDRFGGTVALAEKNLFAGAYGDTVDGRRDAGSGWIFVRNGVQGNIPPQAQDDSFTMTADTELKRPITVLLANDGDADGDQLQIIRLEGNSAKGGTVVLDGDHFIYTPPAGFTGADSFGYTVSDGKGGTATATVHVTLTDADDRSSTGEGSTEGGGGGGGSWGPWPLFLMGFWWALLRHRAPGSCLRPRG